VLEVLSPAAEWDLGSEVERLGSVPSPESEPSRLGLLPLALPPASELACFGSLESAPSPESELFFSDASGSANRCGNDVMTAPASELA